jgi:pyruvate ferredoxin oxidoreductase alpha subunit
VYDTVIQAFKIAEDPTVQLPCMVMFDGFIVSHTLQNVSVLPDNVVAKFVGRRRIPKINVMGRETEYKLDVENPITMGPLALFDYYFEHKRQQEEAIKNAKQIICDVNDEFAQVSGRKYGNGLLQQYGFEDAELSIICLGSTAGTIRTVIEEYRTKGIKVGVIRLKTFRPFPENELKTALRNVKAVAVLDRSGGYGAIGGPVFNELRSILYDCKERPFIVNYIYGLGGRDVTPKLIKKVYEDLRDIIKTGQVKENVKFLGVR